jgi:hypothetical protein
VERAVFCKVHPEEPLHRELRRAEVNRKDLRGQLQGMHEGPTGFAKTRPISTPETTLDDFSVEIQLNNGSSSVLTSMRDLKYPIRHCHLLHSQTDVLDQQPVWLLYWHLRIVRLENAYSE